MNSSSRASRKKQRRWRLQGTAMPAVLGTLLAAALCGDLSALTIYRFGGEDLPAPEEAGREGVEFIQRSWLDPVDPDAGGSLFQVDLGNGTIRAQYYGADENIALTAADRGEGVRESTRKDEQSAAVDGDLTTAWYPEQYLCASFDARQVASGRCSGDYKGIDRWTFGLGGFFYIDKVRIISGLGDEAAIMTNFRVSAASGRVASSTYGIASTRQVFNEMAEIRGNRSEFLDIEFPPHERVDFINVQAAEHNREWAVYEIEVYARGYVESSSYVSDVIEFDRTMAWGDLKWSGSEDPGAEVRIHTRSGNTADQNLYWQYTGRGEKVPVEDAKTYKRLKLGERAGTTYDRDNWTFWSAPYDFADSTGTPVVSLGPRRFFQFKVDVIPSSEAGGELDHPRVPHVGAARLRADRRDLPDPGAGRRADAVHLLPAAVPRDRGLRFRRPRGVDVVDHQRRARAAHRGERPALRGQAPRRERRRAVRLSRQPVRADLRRHQAGGGRQRHPGRDRLRRPGAEVGSGVRGAGLRLDAAAGGAPEGRPGGRQQPRRREHPFGLDHRRRRAAAADRSIPRASSPRTATASTTWPGFPTTCSRSSATPRSASR